MKSKHIHFIGICGVAMSALALAFKRNGWTVTGSDVGFYPPVSTHLKNAGVDYYAGWHVNKMIANGVPDLVVVGNVASSNNPEWLYVQEHKLNYKSYPEVIAEYFIKKNSIVCAGTYGKSTSTSILTWILKEAGYDPSYMFGGIANTTPYSPPSQGGDTAGDRIRQLTPPYEGGAPGWLLPSAEMTNSSWSIVEGDEYTASRWDKGPKFAYYSPTHLLLTSVVWDHADVYPTEADYIAAFQKLVDLVPTNGLQVISEKAASVILAPPSRGAHGGCETIVWPNTTQPSDAKDLHPHYPHRGGIVTYGRDPANDYMYSDITQSRNGIQFTITHKITNNQYPITSSCLGEYMADNLTGCFALANEIGIAPEKIIAAIKTFAGMKRRLEKRYENGVTIFDDIAHSPSKARAILETLRTVYCHSESPAPGGEESLAHQQFVRNDQQVSQRSLLRRRDDKLDEVSLGMKKLKVYAIFEPNTGNRQSEAASWYDNAFAAADEIIIPRLTKLKSTGAVVPKRGDRDASLAMTSENMEGDELAKIMSRTHPKTSYIDDDEKLLNYIKEKIQPGDVVVFMGSHGFRGMIDTLVSTMSKS
ncbi:MAG: hypothetical protein EXS55_04205 [Candidatus Magasanikbacteria bacterium]|nr:hypothetical protein [Candidatus Magasanikbacteria bacterium]